MEMMEIWILRHSYWFTEERSRHCLQQQQPTTNQLFETSGNKWKKFTSHVCRVNWSDSSVQLWSMILFIRGEFFFNVSNEEFGRYQKERYRILVDCCTFHLLWCQTDEIIQPSSGLVCHAASLHLRTDERTSSVSSRHQTQTFHDIIEQTLCCWKIVTNSGDQYMNVRSVCFRKLWMKPGQKSAHGYSCSTLMRPPG